MPDPASDIVLSQTDQRPMYRQIQERIKQLVGAGDWEPGREIPSIRQLAVALRVSVITVKRAYLELEREGVIVTRHGKGSAVAPGARLRDRLRRDQLASQLEQICRLASEMGMSTDDLAAQLARAQTEIQEEQAQPQAELEAELEMELETESEIELETELESSKS